MCYSQMSSSETCFLSRLMGLPISNHGKYVSFFSPCLFPATLMKQQMHFFLTWPDLNLVYWTKWFMWIFFLGSIGIWMRSWSRLEWPHCSKTVCLWKVTTLVSIWKFWVWLVQLCSVNINCTGKNKMDMAK